MPETTNGAPYPAPTDPNNVPADLQALAEWADEKLGGQAALNDAVMTAIAVDPDSGFASAILNSFIPATFVRASQFPVGGPIQMTILGTSILMGSGTTANNVAVDVGSAWDYTKMGRYMQGHSAQSIFPWLCLRSGGRIMSLYNASESGSRLSSQVARFERDVVSKNPDAVMGIGDITNELNNDELDTVIRAYIEQVIAKARDADIPVILTGTVLCRDDPARNARARAHNTWLRVYAWANDLSYIDPFAALIDPDTGALAVVYTDDSEGVHPNTVGAKVAAEKALADLAPILTGDGDPKHAQFVVQGAEANNKLANPLFTADVNSDGNADYWGNAGGASLAVDARVIGKLQSYSVTGATDFNQNFAVDGSAFHVGDRLSLSGLIEVDATSNDFQWNYFLRTLGQAGTWESNPIGYPGGGPVGVDLPLSAFYCELVIPAGATTIWAGGRVFAGTGLLKAAQWCLVNRTTGEVFELFGA